jgi:uncharacterized protein YidB (DUF937 family)
MLENLLQMVKEIGEEQVVNNSLIPNEQNEAVMATASESILGTLQQAIASGRGEELLSMFKSSSSAEIMSNPLAQDIQSGFMENAGSKLGLNSNVVKGLAATMIPILISKLVKRTNSAAPENSGFSLESLFSDLVGGGGRQQQGGLDIGSLIGQFTRGGQQGGSNIGGMLQQLIGGGGGQPRGGGQQDMIGNLIKGFFGK